MQIRSLGGVSWDELAPVFNEAFSDYAVPMVMTPDSLANMQRRRGHVAEASFGAYDGSRLVGFARTTAAPASCRDARAACGAIPGSAAAAHSQHRHTRRAPRRVPRRRRCHTARAPDRDDLDTPQWLRRESLIIN